jgi:AcrR family transcriptional regulator
MLRAPRTPRPRRRDFEDNRRSILDAARLVLAERGPEGLTVSEVAHRAGVNRTTAYQHFRTRDALASAVMAELADELTSMLLEPQAMFPHVDHLVLFFVDHPELARLTLRQLLSQSQLPEPAWSKYREQIRKIAESRNAQPGIDAEMLSYVLVCVGVLWPLVARAQYEGAESARSATQRLTRELKRLLLHGVLRPDVRPDFPESIRGAAEAEA